MSFCPRCDKDFSYRNSFECGCGFIITYGDCEVYKIQQLFLDKYKYNISFLHKTNQTQINWNVKKQKEEYDFDASYDATIKKYGRANVWSRDPVLAAKIRSDPSVILNKIVDVEEQQELLLKGLKYKITVEDIQKYIALM